MRFNLVDQVIEVEPGRMIRAVKNLTLAEEYLGDHFPTFPVMPGVLMLQTLVEAGAWLLRISEDFHYSMIVLREAKNVKFGHFVEPGRRLEVSVELVEKSGNLATLKGRGEVEANLTVSARIVLGQYNLRDRNPAFGATDEQIVAHLRRHYALLRIGGRESLSLTR